MSSPQVPQQPASGVRTPRRADRMDPFALAGFGDLELIVRGIVEGFLIGLHRSPHRGFSVEFAENRPYNAGDDVRFVDWKMYARSDRHYIKQYEEETNLRAYVLLDASGSMDWTSSPQTLVSKIGYAKLLAGSVAALLVRQGDAVGFLSFDSRIREHVPVRGSRPHLRRLLGTLEGVTASGETSADMAIQDVALRLRRRGLVVLASDLLVDPTATLRALRYLRHRGHEVLVFHVLDPAEIDLPSAGEALFVDPESGRELRTNSGALRRRYRESVARALADWRAACLRMGAEYALVSTREPLGLVLGRFLQKRSRLG
ncbi:MAG: DUF58 domain-containing protein [Gemmatimonadota bacterium]